MSNASKFETNALVDRQGKQVSSDLKVTVLGLTPSDWDVTTLEALSEKIMVGIASAATHAYRERGVPFLRNQNILPNKLDVSDILYVSPEYEVSFQNKRLKAGDLLTARTGYPGTTCMIPDAFEGAQSFTTLITRLKTDRVLPEFVCAFMNSEQGQKFFELNQIGGGQKNVNSSILKTFPLPIPQLPEQTAIANALSDVDALIQELEKLIAKKQAIKTATMQQLLTGRTRLPQFAHHPDGRKKGYKPSELGEIPEDWEVFHFGNHFTIYAGGDVPKDSLSSIRSESFPIPIFANAITDKGLYGYTSQRRSKADSVTITARGYLGHAEYRNEEFFPIVRLLVMEPKGELDAKFTAYSINELIEFPSESTGVPQLTAPQVGSFSVAAPAQKCEQTAISSALTDMDEEIYTLEQRMNKTRQIKQGMMQELLTGKTRLVKPESSV